MIASISEIYSCEHFARWHLLTNCTLKIGCCFESTIRIVKAISWQVLSFRETTYVIHTWMICSACIYLFIFTYVFMLLRRPGTRSLARRPRTSLLARTRCDGARYKHRHVFVQSPAISEHCWNFFWKSFGKCFGSLSRNISRSISRSFPGQLIYKRFFT